MLHNLLFCLLLETMEPSYATFAAMMPQAVMVSSLYETSVLSLKSENAPIKKGNSIAPVLNAKSFYAVDLDSGMPLLAQDIFTHRPIASIAKLVTAMVILDAHELNEKTIVSKNAASQEGSQMQLLAGEEITVKALLTGLLINSGNDAAVALAEFDAGSEEAFVKKLNEKASALNLKDTHFSNAKGFDEPANYSTAYDTILFGKTALQYPFIKKTVAIKTSKVESADGKINHKLESTNELLENPYFHVIGLKTGRTPAAGQSFVSLAKGPNNHDILTVVLDSPNRFKETKILLDWIFRNYEFK